MPQIDGTIAVIRGEVHVTAPARKGRMARIWPAEGIAVIVNGNEITEGQAVLPVDKILLRVTAHLRDEERYTLQIDKDLMHVRLRVEPLGAYGIADHRPTDSLTPGLTRIPVNTVTVEEVEKALADMGVTYGINQETIRQAVQQPDGGLVIVASGLPPVPGQAGSLEWLAEADKAEYNPKQRVNYRERATLVTVKAGEPVAAIRPPVPGEPGRNVMDRVIPVEPPVPCKVSVGPGIRLEPDGTMVAEQPGRPVQVASAGFPVVRISPMHEHVGNVDRTSGNLHVKGDVVVTGDVTDGMEVTAAGRAVILGNLTAGVTVKSGGSIKIVGQAIGSTLIAGGNQVYYHTLLPLVQELNGRLDSLIAATSEVMKSSTHSIADIERAGVGLILRAVADRNFMDLNPLANRVLTLMGELGEINDATAQRLNRALRSRVLGGRLFEVRTLQELADVQHTLVDVRGTIETMVEGEADVEVSYCEQSQVQASGSIYLVGQGSYRSKLTAGADIQVHGIVAGGVLRARDHVHLHEVGTDAGTLTLIEVSEKGSVMAKFAHTNVRIHLGKAVHITKDGGPVAAVLDPNGYIRFSLADLRKALEQPLSKRKSIVMGDWHNIG